MTSRTMLIALTGAVGLIGMVLSIGIFVPLRASAELLSSGRSMPSAATSRSQAGKSQTGSLDSPGTSRSSPASPAGPGPVDQPFDPITQMKELGKLSAQALQLDSETIAALKELEAAQRELQRRTIEAERQRQLALAGERRDTLRRAVASQLAIEKKRRRAVANAAAETLARQKNLIRAANAKAGETSFGARQISPARPVHTMARPVPMQAAPLPDQGVVQLALGKEEGANGKVSADQFPSKSAGRDPQHLQHSQQAMAGDRQMQASNDPSPAEKPLVLGLEALVRSEKKHSDKWIENTLADNAARGAVPAIWNLRAQTIGRADLQWRGGTPALYVNSVGAVLLRNDPGILINRKLVQNLQRELRRVGCAPGRVDGKWGRKGRQALHRFNARIDVEPGSRDPDQETLRRLRSTKRTVCRSSYQPEQQRRKTKRISRLSRGARSFKKNLGKKKLSKVGAKKNRKPAIPKETWEQQIFDASL